MARQVLPIVGAVIGAYFGGPQGAQIGYAIGSLVGNAVDPLMIDGPKIGDVAAQTSSEGVYQPIFFGTAQSFGNIIAQGPNIIRRTKQQQGKGGPVTVTERLYKTFAIRIGVSWQGEIGIAGVSRIWENGKLVYDTRPQSTIVAESAEFEMKFRLYLGTDDQLPDPDLEAIYGIGNTPTYRGRAYIVFPRYDITDWKAIPNYQFEVVSGGSSVPAYDTMMSGTRAGLAAENGYAAVTTDGVSWLPVLASELGFSGIPIYANNRWVMLTNTQCAYTDDLTGLTGWQLGTVESAPNTLTSAKHLGNGHIVAAGLSGTCLISHDNGETFNIVSTPSTGNLISVTSNVFGEAIIGSGSNENQLFVMNFGFIIGTASNPATSYSLNAGYFNYDEDAFYVGGGTSVDSDPGEISRLIGPDAFPISVVNDAPSKVVAMAHRPATHIDGPLSVAICNNGEMIYSTTSWLNRSESSFVFPSITSVRQLVFDGQRFIVGYNGDVGNNAVVYTFTDPENIQGPYLDTLDDNVSIATSFMEITSVSGDPPTLAQVVSSIHTFCDQDSSEYTVSELTDILVRGMILAGGYSGSDCIRTLQSLWMIDSPEYDRRIHYHKRGKPIVRLFTFDDLVDEPEEATREQAIEYPAKLHLDYQNPAVEYAPAKATSTRSSIDARVLGEGNVQVPVVLTPDEAAQRAMVLHKVAWADTDGEVIFTVSDEHLDLVPGDCIGLSLRGNIRRLRISKSEYAAGQIKLTCRNDRQSAYTSNVTGIEPPPPTPPPPSIVGPTQLIVGDWPALRDEDDTSTPRRYIAAGPVSPAWNGAQIQDSTDGGSSYNDLIAIYTGAIMGTVQEDITEASPHYTDTTNRVLVQLDINDGSIEIDSLTQNQFQSERGAFALVNSDNSFEICQFRDADDLGEGLYEFSCLMRGRLNSETLNHPIGSRFVLLETVASVSAPSSYIGEDIYHRAISFGNAPENATIVHDVYEGNSQREWPVANLLLVRDVNTIQATAVPRHRFGTEMSPLRSLNWSGYRWVATDGSNSITSDTINDSIEFDVSGWLSPVSVTVYQLNRITGEGTGVTEEIL